MQPHLCIGDKCLESQHVSIGNWNVYNALILLVNSRDACWKSRMFSFHGPCLMLSGQDSTWKAVRKVH
jgi:hypothetical protein